ISIPPQAFHPKVIADFFHINLVLLLASQAQDPQAIMTGFYRNAQDELVGLTQALQETSTELNATYEKLLLGILLERLGAVIWGSPHVGGTQFVKQGFRLKDIAVKDGVPYVLLEDLLKKVIFPSASLVRINAEHVPNTRTGLIKIEAIFENIAGNYRVVTLQRKGSADLWIASAEIRQMTVLKDPLELRKRKVLEQLRPGWIVEIPKAQEKDPGSADGGENAVEAQDRDFLANKAEFLLKATVRLNSVYDELKTYKRDVPDPGTSVIWLLTNREFFIEQTEKLSQELELVRKRAVYADARRVYALARDFIRRQGFSAFTLTALTDSWPTQEGADELSLPELETVPTMLRLAALEMFMEYCDTRKLIAMASQDADRIFMHTVDGMKYIAKADFGAFIRNVSVIDRVLQKDMTYGRMDSRTQATYRAAVHKLAQRSRMAESAVARAAMQMAGSYRVQAPAGAKHPYYYDLRPTHCGYYLVSDGRDAFEESLGIVPGRIDTLRRWMRARRPALYLASMFGVTVIGTFVFTAYLALLGVSLIWTVAATIFWFAVFQDLAMYIVNTAIGKRLGVEPLLRMDFWEGVPDQSKAGIVFNVLLASETSLSDIEANLQRTLRNNEDKNTRIIILADLPEAKTDLLSSADEKAIASAQRFVEGLNEKYARSAGFAPYYLFLRNRVWNERHQAWMGWERKRGAVVELNRWLLAPDEPHNFRVITGDTEALRGTKYVLTLDEDTEVPHGMARRFVEIMAHPLNRPVIDPEENKVVRGYGIIYPWIGLIPAFHDSESVRTLYRQVQLWERGQRDVAIYSYAFPDVQQAIFDEGTFTGKGMFDVAAFQFVTDNRFPPNRLLSHDQIEGFYLRAGLATDMVLLEGTVPKVITDYKRQERWQRGDWQDLPWLFKKIPGIEGGRMFEEKNVVAAHNRWKIFDKIRRTVRPQCMVALLALGLLVPGIPAVLWAGMVVFLLIFTRLPLTLNLRFWLRSLPKIVFFAFYDLCMLPYIAYQNMRALKIIFAEGLIFNPHLKWISAAQSMRFTDTNELKAAVWWARKVFIAMGILAAAVAWLNPPALAVTAGLCIVWAIAPLLIFRLSGPEFPAWLTMYSRLWYFFWMIAPGWSEKKLSAPAGVKGLDQEQAEYLRVVAQDTWNWFAEYVTEEENWLPPDNTAHRASGIEVAHYTSPTNIGLYLVSVVSAWDLGFISREEAVNRVRQTLNIVERLEKWNGHILNYYNTQTLLATRRYISLVDSGNFAACLLVIARAFPQEDVGELAQRLFDKMSFTPLYDFNRGLFYTGYDQEVKHATSAYDESRCPMTEIEEETAKMFNISYYDMLISEARIASFVSVAKGDVDDYHWFNLERQFLRGRAGTIAASWGGTAFEYLMPPLFLKERELSPFWLGRNNERAVKAQISYGRKSGMACWGASECGFVDRDPQAPYSYHAWGTPGIGIKYARKEEQPRPIVAPYAAMMGIEYAPAETVANLKRFEQAGARGRTGFFESLNLEIGGVTQEHMSHHHGMSLIALNNFLNAGAVRERFHSHPLVRNAELLLKEYAPSTERFDPA
ncbi:MAG: glucoamylase family protein, partial [Candidatus Omnitrophica bacterium]|nr:glucoamylase family protein [Candidatus Omnitrophota bacterium]